VSGYREVRIRRKEVEKERKKIFRKNKLQKNVRNTSYTKGIFLQILVLSKLNHCAISKFDYVVPVFPVLLLNRRNFWHIHQELCVCPTVNIAIGGGDDCENK